MITKAQKNQLKQILQSPQWPVIEVLANELIQNKRDASNLRETEWETAKNVAVEEGFVQGINTLIQEIYRNSLNDIE